jgi:uncharacterized protein DUF2800
MSAHAVLSPSGAERWLNCTPSVRLEQQFPDNAGQAAAEGTLAHALGELLLKKELKLIKKFQFEKELAAIKANELYDNSMFGHCEDYRDFVMERYYDAQARTKDALIFLEQKIDLTEYIPEGFGTTDSNIIADHILDVVDLKYGKGVPVSAEQNRQMMVYALGALLAFDMMYDVSVVRMTIYQPRIDNISTWEIPVKDLRKWAENELRPRAKLAFAGEGEFVAGKHCRFCKARGACKANADFNLELAKYDFKDTSLLTDEEISDILDRAKTFITWVGGVEDYALDQAVNHGKKWPGYKVVEGRSNRKYSNEEEVAKVLTGKGYAEEVIYKKKLLGITDMEKELGKSTFADLLTPLIIKPAGKPALAPLSDKRAEYHSSEAAAIEFAEVDI